MDEILQELRALREEVGGLKDQLGVGARVPRGPETSQNSVYRCDW